VTSDNEEPTQVIPEGDLVEQPEVVEPVQPPEPSPEYKGLQRSLQKTQDELETTRKELGELRQRPQAQTQGGYDPVQAAVQSYWNQVYTAKVQAGGDEAQARELANAYAEAYRSQLNLQARVEEDGRREEARRAKDYADRLTTEMHELATDTGVDPNDSDLDYGDGSSADATDRMRRFRQSLKWVRSKTVAQAPVAAQRAPDRSAARVDRQEPTGTPGKPDAEAKVRAFEKLNADINSGAVKPNKYVYADLKKLRDEAIAAGAVF